MNALELAKQLLKNLQEKPEGVEEIKKNLAKAEKPSASTEPKGFHKSMLDEDYAEAFAKRAKVEMNGKSPRSGDELEKKRGVPKGVSPDKMERCVRDVKGKKGIESPHAICAASLQGKTKKEEMGKVDPVADLKVKKDDKPHPAGSPEDKAHDVVEEGQHLQSALGQAQGGSAGRAKLLNHLRTLKDRAKLRSPENRAVGKAAYDKCMLKEEYAFDKKKC